MPEDEQLKYLPANLIILEPSKVILSAGAEKTITMVRREGVEVIEVETGGIVGPAVGDTLFGPAIDHGFRSWLGRIEEIS